MKESFNIALKMIAIRLNNSNINWAITGSVGHLILGVHVYPKDIDIITDVDGAYKIEKIFNDYIIKNVQYSIQKKMKSYFGVLKINGIDIEIMGNVKNLISGEWVPHVDWNNNIIYATIDDIKIPVLSLDYEYKIYKMLNKLSRLKLIEQRLKCELTNRSTGRQGASAALQPPAAG